MNISIGQTAAAIRAVPGVSHATINLATETAEVSAVGTLPFQVLADTAIAQRYGDVLIARCIQSCNGNSRSTAPRQSL